MSVADSNPGWVQRYGSLAFAVIVAGLGVATQFAISNERIEAGADRDNSLSARININEKEDREDHERIIKLENSVADLRETDGRFAGEVQAQAIARDKQTDGLAADIRRLDADRQKANSDMAVLTERLRGIELKQDRIDGKQDELLMLMRQRLPIPIEPAPPPVRR